MPDDKVNSFENTKRQTPKMTFVFVLTSTKKVLVSLFDKSCHNQIEI